MTIKFNRTAANTYLKTADKAALTFPSTAWSLSWVMCLDGLTTGDNPQYILSTGTYQSAGSLNIAYMTDGAGVQASRIAVYNHTDGYAYGSVSHTAGTKRLFVLSWTGSQLILKSAPVLASMPTDGSAVATEFTTTVTGSWSFPADGSGGLFLGARADLAAIRFNDHSLGRFFRFDGTLTDLEIAKLAHGMEITDLGKTPAWYVRCNDNTDYTDRGTQANVMEIYGAPATGTSPGFGYVAGAPATDTVTLDTGYGNRIFQRIGTTSQNIFTGTYSGAVSSVEIQLYAADGTTVVQAWSAGTGSLGNGTFSRVMTFPQGGMYRMAVRSKNGSGVVLATSAVYPQLFGIGDLYGCIGSSSAEKWFQNYGGTGFTPNALTRKYDENGWVTMSTDGAATDMAAILQAKLGVPVGLLDFGIGGTRLDAWLNTSGVEWTPFKNGVTAVGGKLAGVISSMGSNDAAQSGIVSEAQHLANLRTLATNVRNLTGQSTLKIYISGTNTRGDGPTDQYDWVRSAERTAGNDANVYSMQIMDQPLISDQVHLTPAGFTVSCRRMANLIGSVQVDGVYRRGPKIDSITATGSAVTVNISYQNAGNDFTPTTGITGFAVSDSSGAVGINSAVRANSGAITLNCSRALTGTVTVSYMKGKQPVITGAVLDNYSAAYPLDMNQGVSAAVGAAAPVTATKVVLKLVTSANAAQQSLSGLKWAFFDQSNLASLVAPVAKGSTGSTDASGNITLTITGTSLAVGSTGWLVVSDSDGNSATAHKAFSGPVVVS